jgi:hypothetical protein
MSAGARRSLVAAFVLLSVVGLLRSCAQVEEMRPTTLATAPWGFGAFFELAARVFPDATRVRGADVRTPGAAVWWLPRALACQSASATAIAPWPLGPWVTAGGTAIVPLPGPGDATCAIGGDVPTPRRTTAPAKGGATVDGPGIVARTRELSSAPRTFVRPAAPWRVRVRANGEPLVIERPLGAGRLVVVADGSFLTNAQLGKADAALLATELAGAWGRPVFDDGTAGRPFGGPSSYLVRSTGGVPLLALALLGLVIAWHGLLVPARAPSPDDRPAPSLDDFVRSLGRLLRGSRDWSGVLARHRAWAVAALAPRLGLPSSAAAEAVLDRLRAARGAASVAPFEDTAPVGSERELRQRLAAVVAVVEEVTT